MSLALDRFSDQRLSTFDVLSLILIKEGCAAEFMATNSPEFSNAFWHKHLAKDRLRKAIREYLGNDLEEHFSIREGRNQIYGASIHPSHYICGLAMFSPDAIARAKMQHLAVGIPTILSCNTLTDACIAILENSLIVKKSIFRSDDDGVETFSMDSHIEWFKGVVREGPSVFLSTLVTVHHDALKDIFRNFVDDDTD